MALVVLLKGVNVGGHRTFRPSVLANELKRFDVVNIGAAGTFVVRKRIARTELRAEILRRLPFQPDIIMCSGTDICRLASQDLFAGQIVAPDIVQFVSVLAKRRPALPRIPLNLPTDGDWSVRVLGQQGQFVFGLYRRAMTAIRYLDQLENMLGTQATTRNWNTIQAVARTLES